MGLLLLRMPVVVPVYRLRVPSLRTRGDVAVAVVVEVAADDLHHQAPGLVVPQFGARTPASRRAWRRRREGIRRQDGGDVGAAVAVEVGGGRTRSLRLPVPRSRLTVCVTKCASIGAATASVLVVSEP